MALDRMASCGRWANIWVLRAPRLGQSDAISLSFQATLTGSVQLLHVHRQRHTFRRQSRASRNVYASSAAADCPEGEPCVAKMLMARTRRGYTRRDRQPKDGGGSSQHPILCSIQRRALDILPTPTSDARSKPRDVSWHGLEIEPILSRAAKGRGDGGRSSSS